MPGSNIRCSCSTEAKEETLVVLDEAETVDFGIAIGIIYKDFSTAHSFATYCVTSSLFHIFLIGNKLFISCKVIDFVLGFKRTCHDIFKLLMHWDRANILLSTRYSVLFHSLSSQLVSNRSSGLSHQLCLLFFFFLTGILFTCSC
jgi:hypothetical protein